MNSKGIPATNTNNCQQGKRTILLLSLSFLFIINTNAQVSPDITSWLQNTTVTGYGGIISNVQLVQYSANYVYVSTNCIPEYAIGPWPTDPNTPSAQNAVCEFPRNPVPNTGVLTNTPLGSMGLWTNGVQMFNPEDGFHWDNTTGAWAMGPGTAWNRNALIFEGASFDTCLGHPAPGGVYHNHVNPKCLYNDLDSTAHSPIIGYAFDGYPVYGAYGYADTSAVGGTVKRMQTSYALNPDTSSRHTGGGPVPVTTYPMGDCVDDYIYTAGSGDLDEHNGRWCHTPEYPNGTYAYFVSINASLDPVYPLIIGPTYYGILGSNSVHVTPVGPDTTYTGNTAIAQVQNTTIKYLVVPNPIVDHAYIYMDASCVNNITGRLYDMEGRLLKTINYLLQPTIAYALDMSDLPAGTYILSFEGGGKTVTQKLVKE